MRALVAGCSLLLTLLACAVPGSALAASEGCPNVPGGSATLDWGINGSEQIGAGFESDNENSPQPVLGLAGVVHAEAGFKFGLALMSNCTLKAWGSGAYGQLGDGLQQAANHPVAVEELSDVKEIAVANAHAMALLYNGTVWTWGASEFGERGNKERGFERTARQSESVFVPRDKPMQVPDLSGVKQIAAGGVRDYALLDDGEVMAWGEDNNGMLGVKETRSQQELCHGETHAITPVQCSTFPRPVEVGKLGVLTGVERIGASEEAAYAVRKDGRKVLAWGGGNKGQLGDGFDESSASPVRVLLEAASPVVEIVGGAQHALARLADGEVYAWGADGGGELGFETGEEPTESCGQDDCSTVPMPVLAISHVVAVAAGEGNSFALVEEEDGAKVIYAFGANGHYELLGLGNVSITSTAAPTPITGLPSVQSVSASTTTAVAVLETGSSGTPRLSLAAQEGALTAEWHSSASSYKLRDAPAGTREYSKLLEGTCSGECFLPLTGLQPEPYEVTLKTPEAREGKEKTRNAVASALPPKSWPVDVSPPTITGSPATETGRLRYGQTLRASPGTWQGNPQFSYQWLRCDGQGEAGAGEELGTECEPITVGSKTATGGIYEVQSRDVATSIVLRVEAKNSAGTTAAVSAPEVMLGPGEESEPPYPRSTERPAVTGDAVEGMTLTARHGTWENAPTSLEDGWYLCKGSNSEGIGASCGPIASENGAGESQPVTGETYVPSREDVGMWVEVQERATNPGGWEVVASEAVQIAPDKPPANVSLPTITGYVEQGQTLTEHEGSWSNAGTRPMWQWFRCENAGHGCVAIAGATKQTHTIGPDDISHTIVVDESVENGIARSEPVNSKPTEAVPDPPAATPEAQKAPTITGVVQEGETLTAHPGTWTEEPKHFAYQWQRCEPGGTDCTAIAGATATKYASVRADVGKAIVFRETATNGRGSGVASSQPTGAVAGAVPESRVPPAITGYPEQGHTLSEAHGRWANQAESFTYQWDKCNSSGSSCEPVGGATSRTYVAKGADVGATIRVQETAGNTTGTGAPATSAATHPVVLSAPANTTPPTVSGSASEGETLSASPGTWRFSPTKSSYQWLRCRSGECHPIEGATHSTYVLGVADVGFSIAVREASANAGGWGDAVSAAVAVGGMPVPFVTAVEPDAGPKQGGTSVTISGGNFAEATSVAFGFANAASYEILSPDTIRAVAPLGGAGMIYVTVATPNGTSATGPSSQFTYGAPPALSTLEPKEGSEGGGTTVTITGANLGEATAVRFGTADALSFGVQSSDKLVAVSPPGTGTVPVAVETPFGETTAGSSTQFTYGHTGIPTVKKLSVKRGPAAGGTGVTITGTNFTGASAVSFGEMPAASFTVLSQEEITAESPAGAAGIVDVTVTSAFGTSATSSRDHFRYENPIVADVTPETGPLAGGTLVTITGSGFARGEGKTEFKFDQSYATSVECPTTAECTMIAPAGRKPLTIKVEAKANRRNSSTKDAGDEYTYE